MSIYKPDLDKFSSVRFVAPMDEYEVELGAPKLRTVQIKNGERAGQNMHIVAVPARIIANGDGDTEYANKIVSVDFILDENPESFSRLLRFFATVNGITMGTEGADNQFKEQFADADFSVDPESGELGAAIMSMQKGRVVVKLNVSSRGDSQFNQLGGSRPI